VGHAMVFNKKIVPQSGAIVARGMVPFLQTD